MREERVDLSSIDIERLIKATRDHLQELGLKIIDEDVFEGYHSIKARKGGKLAVVTGSVRDVELLITGTEKKYEMRLRTGAWGRDIAIPSFITGAAIKAGTILAPGMAARAGTTIAASVATAGVTLAPSTVVAGVPVAAGTAVALVEAYRAGKFEKNFWAWLKQEIVSIGREDTMSKPQVVVSQPNR